MKMKKADVAVAIYIMAAIIMFIVPIPSWLLDILLAINISVALTILFATMFSKEVLDMSFFPTMLLFTTIFRIALNTSSTRLILRDGNAGNVVETFGEFVGGGDLVIGVIIFIILILIQFMVINKGSERVSEVTARFTLDAMPGKQMAIDADLNTGAITDAEAKEEKRENPGRGKLFRFHGWCRKICKRRCGCGSSDHHHQYCGWYHHGNDETRHGYYQRSE